jgi:hypothetical protein
MLALRLVWPPALDQRVVEHCLVVVLARDHDDLVPDFQLDDPLAVQLSSKAFLVERGIASPAPYIRRPCRFQG